MYRVAFTVGAASFLRGDVNGDGEVGIADVTRPHFACVKVLLNIFTTPRDSIKKTVNLWRLSE